MAVSKKQVMSEEEQAHFKGFIKHLGETLHEARNKEELIDILTYCIRKTNNFIKTEKSL